MSREENVQYLPVRVAAEPETGFGRSDVPAEGDAQASNPLPLIHSLLRGRYWVAGALALVGCVAGGAIGWVASKPVFQSSGVLEISAVAPAGPDSRETLIPMFDSYVQSQVALIQSDGLIGQSMDAAEWQALGRGLSPTAVSNFASSMTVDHPRGSQLIQVSFSDTSPQAAQIAVRSVMNSFLAEYDSKTSESGTDRMRNIANEVLRRTNTIRDKTEHIDAMTKATGSANVEMALNGRIKERDELQSRYNDASLKLAIITAVRKPSDAKAPGADAAAEKANPSDEALASRDVVFKEYLHQQMALESKLRGLRSQYGPSHAKVKETDAELTEIKARKDRYAKEAAANYALGGSTGSSDSSLTKNADPEILRIETVEVQKRIDAKSKEIADLSGQFNDWKRYSAERDKAQAELDELTKENDALTAAATLRGRAKTVSVPDLPVKPLKDKRVAFSVAGCGLGGGMGVGLVLLAGFLNRRLRHIEDAHRDLCKRVPLLGMLPYLPKDIADPEQAAVAVHAVHHIRTMLQLSGATGAGNQTFALTSPAAGDGKTSLTMALGLSFAACGARTLLIDCDLVGGGLTARMARMVRPKLGRILRRESLVNAEQVRAAIDHARRNGCRMGESLVTHNVVTVDQVDRALMAQQASLVGLLDVLGGEPLDECVASTDSAGLFVLPIGSAKPRHVSKLSRSALRRVLDEAKKEFDVVLIDTGPILGSLEAAILAPEVDGVVLTVSRGEQHPVAKQSMKRLESIGARIAGVVFNRAHGYDINSSRFSSSASMRARSHPALGRTMPAKPRMGPLAAAIVADAAEMVDGSEILVTPSVPL